MLVGEKMHPSINQTIPTYQHSQQNLVITSIPKSLSGISTSNFRPSENYQRYHCGPSPFDLGCYNRQAFSPPSVPTTFPKNRQIDKASEKTSSTFWSRELSTRSFLSLTLLYCTIEKDHPRVHSLVPTCLLHRPSRFPVSSTNRARHQRCHQLSSVSPP